jgi:hypothetical protein
MSIPIAETQFNEMTGTASADTHSGIELSELLKSKGVDNTRYLPVGFSFSGIPPESFVVYAVDMNVTKPGFDNIAEYAVKQDGVLPIVEFNIDIGLDEMAKYIKRLEVVVIRKITHLKSFHKIDSVDLV